MLELKDYVLPYEKAEERNYHKLQWGARVLKYGSRQFDWDKVDVVLVGCELNHAGDEVSGCDAIRREFYETYCWHNNVGIGDIGDIKCGITDADTLAALHTVLDEIYNAGKTAVLLADDHALTMQQYEVFRKRQEVATCTVADMYIDLNDDEGITEHNFLMEMLTGTPNFIKHYNHIAFQSYFTQPRTLETLDKLRFDFYRLGKVREYIEDMEPVLRATDFFSFDIAAVRYPDAIMNIGGSPNGLTGEDACTLTRYAGMSDKLSSMGIFGYIPGRDVHNMTAKLIAQMLWYFVDGVFVKKSEAAIDDGGEFISYSVVMSDIDATFLKSKRTNRWWMKLPDGNYIPCSYNDYLVAGNNDIPERWLREQERLV